MATRFPLQGGAYSAKSLLAAAQRCVGLYAERNPPDAIFPFAYYLLPGLRPVASAPVQGPGRGFFCLSDGTAYSVVGSNIYKIATDWTHTLVGTLTTSSGMTSMKDNGLSAVVVDGTANGRVLDMSSPSAFVPINDGGTGDFYGSTFVDYVDTYLVFNRPTTADFYIAASEASPAMLTGGPIVAGVISNAGSGMTAGTYSSVQLTNGSGSGATADITTDGTKVTSVTIIEPGASYRVGDHLGAYGLPGPGFDYQLTQVGSSAFDPLDVAAKTGAPDPVLSIAVMHAELWLIGSKTTEVFYDSGAADFAFQRMPGVFIEHGTCAPWSVAHEDLNIYWLSQDAQGARQILRGNNYAASTISTRALEVEIQGYARVDDAIGWTWQLGGHARYQISFPSAVPDTDINGQPIYRGRTWIYDEASDTWSERPTLGTDGAEDGWRVRTGAFFNGMVVGQDWETGALYVVDPEAFTDAGTPIKRVRSWPHSADAGQRLTYHRFQVSMEVGGAGNGIGRVDVDAPGSDYTSAPAVSFTSGSAQAVAELQFAVSGLMVTNPGTGYATPPSVVFSGGGGAGATAVASVASVVSSLNLTAPGAGYTSVPTVTFSGGGGSGAAAHAVMSFVISAVSLTAGGAGYSTPPAVVFTGTGSGAAATATLTAGVVWALNLTNQGSGYTSNPTVSITGGGGTGATATATSGGSGVTAVSVTAGGSYSALPTVNFSGTGSGAAATAVGSGSVLSVAIDDPGSGYTSAPTVRFVGGGGSGAVGFATLSGGGIGSIVVTNGGSGYTSAPIVFLSGGHTYNPHISPSDASAHSVLGLTVTGVTITNPGSGYTAAPTVVFTGSGSGATATSSVGSGNLVLNLTNPGTGYSSPPAVSISGGGGSGATATATIHAQVGSVTLTNPGSGYTSPPTVSFVGDGNYAAATASVSGTVAALNLTSGGSGYTSAPAVAISGGHGATATAAISMGVSGLTLVSPGSGYNAPPAISFLGAGSGATATASMIGSVAQIDVTNPGMGYADAPGVILTGGGGSGAIASASLSLLDPAAVSLRWSDTAAKTWGNPVERLFGPEGAYGTSLLWTRLGMARDRVFEVSWDAPVPTALLGAFVTAEGSET